MLTTVEVKHSGICVLTSRSCMGGAGCEQATQLPLNIKSSDPNVCVKGYRALPDVWYNVTIHMKSNPFNTRLYYYN